MGNYLSNTTLNTVANSIAKTVSNTTETNDISATTREENITYVVSELVDDMIKKAIAELGNPNDKCTNTDNNITEEHKISDLKKELNDQRDRYYSLVDEFELLKGESRSLSENLQISRNQNMKLRKTNYELCNKKTLLETELRNYRFKNYYLRDMIDEMKSNLILRKSNKILNLSAKCFSQSKSKINRCVSSTF
jgi:hypothetical protein